MLSFCPLLHAAYTSYLLTFFTLQGFVLLQPTFTRRLSGYRLGNFQKSKYSCFLNNNNNNNNNNNTDVAIPEEKLRRF
jgi:hypothetical protein